MKRVITGGTMKRVIAIVVLLVNLLGVSTTTQAQSVPPYSVYLPIVMKPAIPPTYLTNPPIAKNHLETQYQNGVTLELSRIYIASKDYLVQKDPSFGTHPIFDDSQTLVEIMFT